MPADLSKATVPIATVAVCGVAMLGVYQWMEQHYALAGEVQAHVQSIDRKIDDLRRKQLMDQKFELEFVPEAKRTDYQRAQLERIKAELQQLERK